MRNLWLTLSLLFTLLAPQSRGIDRILFVGNSITLSRPSTALAWPGLWGMAASQADKDYAHQVQLMLATKQGFAPEIAIISADLHRWDEVTPDIMFRGETVQEFDPDLVIVQMGDNARVETPYEYWEMVYRQIITWAPDARFIAIGKWGGKIGNAQEDYIRRAAAAAGMQYIRIRDLHTDDAVAAQYTNTAVAWHPNDTGHRLIAERIIRALQPATWMPWVTNSGNGTIPGGTIP